MNTKTRIPIGLNAGVEAVQKISSKAHIYYRCGLQPPHYIANIDAGNGQTTFTEYVAEVFSDTGIRHFGGLDNYLEFDLDGSMNQLKKVFSEIRSCAVYTNEIEGIIAMDITKLAAHINESQIEYFINEITKMGNYATFIFYVPSIMNRNVANLVSKVVGALNEVEILNMQPYSNEEIIQIIKVMIEDAGIMIEDSEEINNMLLNIVVEDEINTVKAAKKFGRKLIKAANFDSFIPKITVDKIRNICFRVVPVKKGVK